MLFANQVKIADKKLYSYKLIKHFMWVINICFFVLEDDQEQVLISME